MYTSFRITPSIQPSPSSIQFGYYRFPRHCPFFFQAASGINLVTLALNSSSITVLTVLSSTEEAAQRADETSHHGWPTTGEGWQILPRVAGWISQSRYRRHIHWDAPIVWTRWLLVIKNRQEGGSQTLCHGVKSDHAERLKHYPGTSLQWIEL